MRALTLLLAVLACGSGAHRPTAGSPRTAAIQEQRGSAVPATTDSLRYLYRWEYSGIQHPGREEIGDAMALERAWHRVHAGRSITPDTPVVDFARHAVLLVAIGQRPTTGYALAIDSVRLRRDVLHVFIAELGRDSYCLAGSAYTQPTLLVVVPRSNGPIMYHVLRRTLSCWEPLPPD